MRKDEIQPSGKPEKKEGFCLGEADRIIGGQRGIVGAEVDHKDKAVTLEYNPEDISEEEVAMVATRVVPQMHGNFHKCTLRLTGRACEACALKIESNAEKIPGVRRARATFIGGTMSLTFDEDTLPAERVLIEVRKIGAPVEPHKLSDYLDEEPDRTIIGMIKFWLTKRLEIIFTGLTLGFILAAWIGGRLGLASPMETGLYLSAYFTGCFFGIQAIWQSLRRLTINVDLLMLLAAVGAACVQHAFEGATLLFLFSLSNVLQSYAIERTRKAIHSLMQLRPENAMVRRDGQAHTLPIDELKVGDIVIVRPGERVPLDGTVIEGQSAIDESSLTGESIPVAKKTGDTVFAGTINQTGGIEVRVTKLAKDSTIARLIQMVEEAQTEKAKTQRWLDYAEQYYAIGVILFTLSLIGLPMLFSHDANFTDVFYRAMTVMVVASPCALIISTPATILSAIGGAAWRGVLFKGGAHLEKTAGVTVVVLDKTGTITEGRARVTDIFGPDEPGVIQLAAAVEAKSEHPLAHAIVAECKRRQLPVPECTGFQSVSRQGAGALVENRFIAVGNERFFDDYDHVDFDVFRRKMLEFQEQGKTAVLIAQIEKEGRAARPLGVIAIADVLREDAASAIRELKSIGVKRVVMLTGDNRHVAGAIARQAGIDEYYAELRPEDKMRIIKSIREHDSVAMIGDGVNDAPALAAATVGIAMGAAGTDVAMETADVVLMSNNLHNVAFAIGLSRQARRVVFQNLAFALTVIILLIASALGLHLKLTFGVIGHEGSTVLVCLNGLRLLAFRPRV